MYVPSQRILGYKIQPRLPYEKHPYLEAPPSKLRHICRKHFLFHLVELKKTEFYEQMTSNLAFTERNVQKANAYRFPCIYRKDIVVGCPWLVS